MLKIDANGFRLVSEHADVIPTYEAPDNTTEGQITSAVAKRVRVQNHNKIYRETTFSVNDRREWLNDGDRIDVSLHLRVGDWEGEQGFIVRTPLKPYKPDLLLKEVLTKWLNAFIELKDLSNTEVVPKVPLLFPNMENKIERPARAEIYLCSINPDLEWDYWIRPNQLIMFAEHIQKAINEYDDKLSELLSSEDVSKEVKENKPATETKKPRKKRTPRIKV